MNTIKLTIPERNNNPSVIINPSVEQIKNTLDALPLANADKSCEAITQQLFKLNRAPLDVQVRIQIMKLIQPLLEDIVGTQRATYINAALPLSEKRQKTANMINTLLTEMSFGYKIIVHDLIEDQQVTAVGSRDLPQAIYYALSFLARLLVDDYALYTGEPKKIWLELNQLYLYAEKQEFHNTSLIPVNEEKEPNPATIANAYRRIVIIALANPYHLMQGEAVKLYQLLTNWAQHCEITSLNGGPLPEGKLFIDLAMDAPPLYAPKVQTKLRPLEGRLLDIKDLISDIDTEIRRLTLEGKSASRQSSLAHRMERDMYFRWTEALGNRRERMSHRKPFETPINMICGLTASHHYISDNEPFNPEENEIDIRGQQAEAGHTDSLSLVPENTSPWEHEEKSNRIKLGIDQPRKSQFDFSNNADHKDMWVKVFASSAQAIEELTGEKKANHEIHDCQVININQGGYGLFCPIESKFPARVGELLGSQTENTLDSWAIGSVRWMRISDEQGISLGVRYLEDDARSVATKAVIGIGKGGEYYRSLLLPDVDPRHKPATLITPAAVYDIGSVIMITMKDEIFHAKLTEQLESTSAFSHYQFEIVDAPEDEKQLSPGQEARKSDRLFR